jgi:hypothetical protein
VAVVAATARFFVGFDFREIVTLRMTFVIPTGFEPVTY